MNKGFRHGQILKLIRAKPIHTQDELAHELKESVGLITTQVTLSRDIHQLGLVKTSDGYRQIADASGPDLSLIALEFLQDIRVAQNLVVLRTSPAHASTVAVALDNEEWPEIVGTIAGDDTVLVIAPDNDAASKLVLRLRELIGG